MKKLLRRDLITELWRRIVQRHRSLHDPYLSLSITQFNDGGGWEQLLRKEQQFTT